MGLLLIRIIPIVLYGTYTLEIGNLPTHYISAVIMLNCPLTVIHATFLQQQQALIASFQQSVTDAIAALSTSQGQLGQHLQGLTAQLSARSTPGSTTTFASSLADAIPDLIDYNSKAGIHLLETSQKGTAVDFDGGPTKLEGWLSSVSTISSNIGLDNITKITDSNGDKVDLFKQGAAVRTEVIRAQAQPYVSGNENRSRPSSE